MRSDDILEAIERNFAQTVSDWRKWNGSRVEVEMARDDSELRIHLKVFQTSQSAPDPEFWSGRISALQEIFQSFAGEEFGVTIPKSRAEHDPATGETDLFLEVQAPRR